jgi:hypothetical protein
MNPMEQAIANHRKVALEAREAREKSGEAERELGSLRDKLAALEGNVASAEQAHVIADAAQQLGEESNLEAARNALKDACKALADAAPELKHKIRVSELLVEKFTAAVMEATAKQQGALVELNECWDEQLRGRLREEVEKAKLAETAWLDAQEKSIALKRFLEGRMTAAGRGWSEDELKWVVYNGPRPINGTAIMSNTDALQAETAAATKV